MNDLPPKNVQTYITNDETNNSPNRTEPISEARKTYNIASDIGGALPNTRLWDNLFQLAAMAFCTILGICIALPFLSGPDAFFVGGFFGLLVGLLGSGAAIGIFRASRHIKGKHD